MEVIQFSFFSFFFLNFIYGVKTIHTPQCTIPVFTSIHITLTRVTSVNLFYIYWDLLILYKLKIYFEFVMKMKIHRNRLKIVDVILYFSFGDSDNTKTNRRYAIVFFYTYYYNNMQFRENYLLFFCIYTYKKNIVRYSKVNKI